MRQDQGSTVSVHPFMHDLIRRAEHDPEARAYVGRLRDRDRACRALARLLRGVEDGDRVELGTMDDAPAMSILADAEQAVSDRLVELEHAENATARRRARAALDRAIEARRIVARAELVCSDPRRGVGGDRTVGGRMFRHSRPTYACAAGRILTVEDAREVPIAWQLSPRRLAGRLSRCAQSWATYGTPGGAGSAPIRCGAPLCPRCMGAEAGARVRAWFPVVESLRAAGCVVVHLTATQQASLPGAVGAVRRPVVLSDGAELARYSAGLRLGGGRLAVREGAAVPGPSLGSRIATLAEGWRQMTNTDKRARAWWSGSVVGALLGREWTGSRETAPGLWWLRWHVHQHALVVLRPEAELRWIQRGDRIEAERVGWWLKFLDWWGQQMPGADPAGQHLSRVEDTGAALVEVLKYPFKPAALTQAQAAETIAATAGQHHHQVSGCWHGRSAIGRAARGEDPGRALDASEERIAVALGEGFRRRELEAAGSEAVLLYREPEPREPARARRMFRPMDYHDPWASSPPERVEVVPVTIGWIRWAIDQGRSEVLAHEYRTGRGWEGPRSWGLGTLLNLCEEAALGASASRGGGDHDLSGGGS